MTPRFPSRAAPAACDTIPLRDLRVPQENRRMHPRRNASLLLALALALAAPAAVAANRGVTAAGGDSFASAIGFAGDVDCYVLDLPLGGVLSATVTPAKGSGFAPAIEVRRPDGTPADVAGFVKVAGSGKLSLKNVPVGLEGRWAVCVAGQGTSTGAYTVSFKTKAPKKAVDKGLDVPTGTDVLCEATGDTGALLSFTVAQKSGPSLADVQVLDPEGTVVPATILHKGSKWSAKGVPLASGFGNYAVRLTGGVGPGSVDCTVGVKFLKHTALKVALGPEPRVTDVQPRGGIAGVPVTVTGTEFQSGARVFFGDGEASPVAVAPAGDSLTCDAASGTQSDDGLTIALDVQNPDGQVGSFAAAFAYLGVPGPDSVSPGVSPLAGGVTITITGSRFRDGATVSVGGTPPTGVTVQDGEHITCVTPAHAEGPVDIVVFDEFARPGAALSGHAYAGPPTLTAADPAAAPSHGGDTVTLTGTSFRTGARLFVDGNEVTPIAIASTTSMSFTMPAGAKGPATVRVEDEFVQSSPTYGALLARAASFVSRTGTAIPSAPSGTEFFGRAVGLGDLDKDLDRDIVVLPSYPLADGGGSPVVVPWMLRNDGSWTFTDVTATKHATFKENGDQGQGDALLVGDLDADGDADVLVGRVSPLYSSTYASYTTTYSNPGGTVYTYPTYDYPTYLATRVLRNDGTGALTDVSSSALPVPTSTPLFGSGERWQAAAFAMGDLDGDSKKDLVLLAAPPGVQDGTVAYYIYTSGGTSYVYFYEQGTYIASTRVMINNGSGVFTRKANAIPAVVTSGYYVLETWDGTGVALGDVDGDAQGTVDIVIARPYPYLFYQYDPNTMTGSFTYLNASRVLLNDGTARFTASANAIPAGYPSAAPGAGDAWEGETCALGDLDKDGDLDLVLGRRYPGYWYDAAAAQVKLRPAIRILSNDGTGRFAEANATFLASSSTTDGGPEMILSVVGIALGDLDGDLNLDMVTTGTVYYVYDYNATGAGYFGFLSSGYRTATHVLQNDGTGMLLDATERWFPPVSNGDYRQGDGVVLGDLDGDGDLDMAITYGTYPDTPYNTTGHNRPLRVFENR